MASCDVSRRCWYSSLAVLLISIYMLCALIVIQFRVFFGKTDYVTPNTIFIYLFILFCLPILPFYHHSHNTHSTSILTLTALFSSLSLLPPFTFSLSLSLSLSLSVSLSVCLSFSSSLLQSCLRGLFRCQMVERWSVTVKVIVKHMRGVCVCVCM